MLDGTRETLTALGRRLLAFERRQVRAVRHYTVGHN